MVRDPLTVAADGLALVRNRGGLLVILDAPGFHDVTTVDDPPPTPPPGTTPFTLSVRDRSRRYLPRRVVVALPRDNDKANAGQALSVFWAIDARMYPAPGAAVGPNWAVIRADVVRGKKGVPNVLIRVAPAAGGAVIGTGLTDANGQALVGMTGVAAVTTGNGGAVLSRGLDVVVNAFEAPPAPGGAGPSAPDLPDTDSLEAAADGMAAPSGTDHVHIDPGQETHSGISLP
jgi:hypothetical protein